MGLATLGHISHEFGSRACQQRRGVAFITELGGGESAIDEACVYLLCRRYHRTEDETADGLRPVAATAFRTKRTRRCGHARHDVCPRTRSTSRKIVEEDG